VGAALYRIAQEAVTNARRHARRATIVHVELAAAPAAVKLLVVDDGEPGAVRRPGGFGLVGMAERAELLGGTVHAGPAESRGWAIDAVIPLVRVVS
jgi:signal transduction histidine kinase